jgi:hypothetical protein
MDIMIEGYSVLGRMVQDPKISKLWSGMQCETSSLDYEIMKTPSSEIRDIHVKIVKRNFNQGINSVQTLWISSGDSDLLAFRPSM